jgi:hypothetical protein
VGSVFPGLADELAGDEKSSGALRFLVDQPLPAEMVNKLIAVRLRQAVPAGSTGAELPALLTALPQASGIPAATWACTTQRAPLPDE